MDQHYYDAGILLAVLTACGDRGFASDLQQQVFEFMGLNVRRSASFLMGVEHGQRVLGYVGRAQLGFS